MGEASISGLALPHLLGGGTAPLSPFQRSPFPSHGSLPPLLGPHMHPATKEGIPPWIPPASFLRNDAVLGGNLTEPGGEGMALKI